jgi:predicted metal-dependent hydrolase
LHDKPLSEARTADLGGRRVSYVLRRSGRRRTLCLMVDHRGLTVNAPMRTSDRRIDAFLRGSADWIARKLDAWAASHRPAPAWADGQPLRYLGEDMRLALRPGLMAMPPVLARRELVVTVPDPADATGVGGQVVDWYRDEALGVFRREAALLAPRLGVAEPPLALSSAQTRWGSCNRHGEVRLNWRLVQAPLDLVRYVVAHELAHLRHMDHSPRFWAAVGEAFPDWRTARARLHREGGRLMAFAA